jgi:hypothetical protein
MKSEKERGYELKREEIRKKRDVKEQRRKNRVRKGKKDGESKGKIKRKET